MTTTRTYTITCKGKDITFTSTLTNDEAAKVCSGLRSQFPQDLARKYGEMARLSGKQIGWMHFMAIEQIRRDAEPKPEPEQHVAVPVEDGRQRVEGEVVSVKLRSGAYGDAWKMTVKVETPDGSWLVWGTVPRVLEDLAMDAWKAANVGEDRDPGLYDLLKGRRVAFDAKLTVGREEHFAFFKRPTKPALELVVVAADEDNRLELVTEVAA